MNLPPTGLPALPPLQAGGDDADGFWQQDKGWDGAYGACKKGNARALI